jgi:AcrR family transcriptional regulator
VPYPSEHREQVREKILRSARRLFNRRGFNAVSIDDIMADAGLTRGSFYTYFASKTDLYAASVARIVSERTLEAGDETGAKPKPPEAATQIIRDYLSRRHFEDVEGGCPMVALPSDISRTDPRVREAFEAALRLMVEIFEQGLTRNEQEPRTRALAISALCVGGMVLARSIKDLALADEVREAAMTVALSLGQPQ